MLRSFGLLLVVACSALAPAFVSTISIASEFAPVDGGHEVTLPTPRPCVCPRIYISADRKEVTEGDVLAFKADVFGGKDATYNWTISGGMMISGQGTKSITVDTMGTQGNTLLTATLEVGQISSGCECTIKASAMAEVKPRAIPSLGFGTIYGRVVNAKGKGMAKVRVSLEPARAGSVMTDASGRYSFEGVPSLPVPYRVSAGFWGKKAYVNVLVDNHALVQAQDIKLR